MRHDFLAVPFPVALALKPIILLTAGLTLQVYFNAIFKDSRSFSLLIGSGYRLE